MRLSAVTSTGASPKGIDLGYSSSSTGVLNVLASSGPITVSTGGSGIDIVNASSSATIGYKTDTSVTSSTSNILIVSDIVNSVGNLNNNTSGTLTIRPTNGNSFKSAVNTTALRFSADLSGLTIGHAENTQNITIGSATTIAGPINLYGGNIAINGATTATGSTINLHASGAVSQTAAISASG